MPSTSSTFYILFNLIFEESAIVILQVMNMMVENVE